MWSFDNIQVFIALTRQGFVSTLYFYIYTGFSGMGNVNCTGGAFGFSCLSVPTFLGTCRTSGVPWLVKAPVFGDVFVAFFPTLMSIWEPPVCAVVLFARGRWSLQGCTGVKGDLLICGCLHGISKELLSVPFLPFPVAEALEIYICLCIYTSIYICLVESLPHPHLVGHRRTPVPQCCALGWFLTRQ